MLNCHHGGHPPRPHVDPPPAEVLETAAAMFQALGDPLRLRLLTRLAGGEACVLELAEIEGEKISTISARLKLLHGERLVSRRREAKHIFYGLVDNHVLTLIETVFAHTSEAE